MHRPKYHYQRGKQVSPRRFSLDEIELSDRFLVIASWPRSKSTLRYPRVPAAGRDTITADLRRSIAPKKKNRPYVTFFWSITIFQRRLPVDWRLLYRSCLFYLPRFDQGFINFLLDRILSKDRSDYSAREKITARIKTVIYANKTREKIEANFKRC